MFRKNGDISYSITYDGENFVFSLLELKVGGFF